MVAAKNYRDYWLNKLPNTSRTTKVLEVGAGIGSNVKHLLDRFELVSLIEPDVSQQNLLRGKFHKEIHNKQVEIFASYDEIPAHIQFDLILYIDVLEHIEDDSSEINMASLRVKQGGVLFILVPAFEALYSNYDKKLGHHRRYSKRKLIEIVEIKMDVESVIYIDSIGILGVVMNKILHNSNISKAAVKIWDTFLIPASRAIDGLIFNNKLGKSLLLIAHKK